MLLVCPAHEGQWEWSAVTDPAATRACAVDQADVAKTVAGAPREAQVSQGNRVKLEKLAPLEVGEIPAQWVIPATLVRWATTANAAHQVRRAATRQYQDQSASPALMASAAKPAPMDHQEALADAARLALKDSLDVLAWTAA